MRSKNKPQEATYESAWKLIQENAKGIREMKKESRREWEEIRQKFKETSESIKHTEKMIENTNKQIGGISRSNGEFCEEYFINSFKENPTFMGEKYDYVIEYLRPYPNTVIADEYDLVLHNGSTVVLIEMKYKANIEDVGKMFSKLHSYRANYPMNKDYKIYLALASFRFPAKVRKRANEEGIVLIEQRGDKIEVISEKVTAW